MHNYILIRSAVLLVGCLGAFSAQSRSPSSSSTEPTGQIFKLSVADIDGQSMDFEKFKGKVLLIVNTASNCGYTPQFKGLQKLQDTYGKRGLQVIGFPSNDFRQENKDAKEIKKVACDDYKVTFPLAKESSVNGSQRNPVYKYLVARAPVAGLDVQWNFEKFLLDRSGEVRGRYLSSVSPEDPKLISELEKLLAAKTTP